MKIDNNIPYFVILKKSFVITWKNRYLWWFGFFTLLSNISGFDYLHNDHPKNYPLLSLEKLPHTSPWILTGLTIISILLISITILSIISRGALISSIGKLIENKNTNFKTGYRFGKKNFWKIFSIALFSGVFLLTGMLILTPPVIFLFLNHSYLLGFIMATIAVIIFIPLIFLVFYIKLFGYLYAILGGLTSWAAIENAYNLFRKNIHASILMALIFIPINLLFFFSLILILVPIALLVLPIALFFFLLAGTPGAIVAGMIGLLFLAIYILSVRSVLEVFAQTIWILFFHEIAAPKEKEIIIEPVVEMKTLPETGLPTINLEGK
jgi:hypothetical protein